MSGFRTAGPTLPQASRRACLHFSALLLAVATADSGSPLYRRCVCVGLFVSASVVTPGGGGQTGQLSRAVSLECMCVGCSNFSGIRALELLTSHSRMGI